MSDKPSPVIVRYNKQYNSFDVVWIEEPADYYDLALVNVTEVRLDGSVCLSAHGNYNVIVSNSRPAKPDEVEKVLSMVARKYGYTTMLDNGFRVYQRETPQHRANRERAMVALRSAMEGE